MNAPADIYCIQSSMKERNLALMDSVEVVNHCRNADVADGINSPSPTSIEKMPTQSEKWCILEVCRNRFMLWRIPTTMPKWRTVTKLLVTILILLATRSKSNARRRIWMLYAYIERSAIGCRAAIEFRALCLPINALRRIAEISRTVTEMRADCLCLTGKICIFFILWCFKLKQHHKQV